MTTVNEKIKVADYNSRRFRTNRVLGVGSADYGYGQTVQSSDVSESNKVGVTEWGKLRYDIINCYKHIFGTIPTIYTPVVSDKIKSDLNRPRFRASISGNILTITSIVSPSGVPGMAAIGQEIEFVVSPVIPGTKIIGEATPFSLTISSFASKTPNTTYPAPPTVFTRQAYNVTYNIPTQPEPLPAGTEVIISGNSTSSYNARCRIVSGTTTSVTVLYIEDPDLEVTRTILPFGPGGSDGVTLRFADQPSDPIIIGQSVVASGFTSGQTVVSIGDNFNSVGINAPPNVIPEGPEVLVTSLTSADNGKTYVITDPGTTDFTAIGAANNLVGTAFVKTGGTGSGSGKIKQRLSIPITFKFSYGTGTTTLTATSNNPHGLGRWILNNSQTVSWQDMIWRNNEPYLMDAVNTLLTSIENNRFVVHPTQSIVRATDNSGNPLTTSTTWPGPYGTSWSSRIQCVVTASWTSANAARHFFNSGGLIRFNSSRSGGTIVDQNTSWTNLLGSVGTPAFGGNTPRTGTSPQDGGNYYRCTSSPQNWYTLAASSPYGSNSFRIAASTPGVASNIGGTASSVQFLVEWIDNYTDPGGPPPGDNVDGTFTLSVSYLYASGDLEPPGTGTFTVERPQISIGTITP